LKISQASLGAAHYLSEAQQVALVREYLVQVSRVSYWNHQLNLIYADPTISDQLAASAAVRAKLTEESARLDALKPLAESILQQQVASVAAEAGLTLGGQTVPPVLSHVTDLPMALIVSPREAINQSENLSIQPGLTAEAQDALESQVAGDLNVSTLVVPIGGIGTYPSMIMSTSDLAWLAEVIAHEWTHNFLTLRPLGVIYDTSPELRSINETTADLAGRELGLEVIRRYYPEDLPEEVVETPEESPRPAAPEAPRFSFRKEMHQTRVTVDALLAKGKIEAAEAYMEARRSFFWDNGYLIRKLNQAYFAFYGAYNDVSAGGNSSGAAGADPIGPAVVSLREKSASLGQFLNRISWITSFEQLQQAAE